MKNLIPTITWVAYGLMMIFGALWVLRETGVYNIPKPDNLVIPTLAFGFIGFIFNRLRQARR